MTKDIKWIFFDVGSTLADESEAYLHRIRDAIAGTNIAYQEFWDRMIEFYRNNQKGDLETLRHYGLEVPKWHKEDEKLYPDAEECLKRLKPRYKIGVIANQSLGTKDRLEAFGILKYIDLVIASAEEGVSKPNPRIFEIALERAGCRPENAVMAGDRLDNDITPANALGMTSIWIKQGFSRYGTPKTVAEQPDYIVNSLTEICDLFGQ